MGKAIGRSQFGHQHCEGANPAQFGHQHCGAANLQIGQRHCGAAKRGNARRHDGKVAWNHVPTGAFPTRRIVEDAIDGELGEAER